MPTQEGTTEDALVPGTFVPWPSRRAGKNFEHIGWIVADNGCHIWQGWRSEKGYGKVCVGGRKRRVHRVRYEREVGPIPEGMVLDHFACDNRLCCNPAHVRPVTQRENLLRGGTVTARNAAVSHCPKGHEYSVANTYIRPNNGERQCRACKIIVKREYRKRKRLNANRSK